MSKKQKEKKQYSCTDLHKHRNYSEEHIGKQ